MCNSVSFVRRWLRWYMGNAQQITIVHLIVAVTALTAERSNHDFSCEDLIKTRGLSLTLASVEDEWTPPPHCPTGTANSAWLRLKGTGLKLNPSAKPTYFFNNCLQSASTRQDPCWAPRVPQCPSQGNALCPSAFSCLRGDSIEPHFCVWWVSVRSTGGSGRRSPHLVCKPENVPLKKHLLRLRPLTGECVSVKPVESLHVGKERDVFRGTVFPLSVCKFHALKNYFLCLFLIPIYTLVLKLIFHLCPGWLGKLIFSFLYLSSPFYPLPLMLSF